MKKFLPILIALLTAGLLLTACGKADPTPVPATPTSPASPDSGTEPELSPPVSNCIVMSGETPDLARPDDHITGALEDYAVTIVIYNDFTCPGCASMATFLNQAVAAYPDDIRLITRHYTSPARNALFVAWSITAAAEQGYFAEVYDAFYTDPAAWLEVDEAALGSFLYENILPLGLDSEAFFASMDTEQTAAVVQAQYEEAINYLDMMNASSYPGSLAAAGEAAGYQDDFWGMFQEIQATSETWKEMDQTTLDAHLAGLAAGLGLDPEQFAADYAALSTPSDDGPSPLRKAYDYFYLLRYTSPGLAAARAAEAAGRQGKFWEMHDLLFAEQALWVDLEEQAFLTYLSGQFEALGIDPDQFLTDYADPAIEEIIARHFIEAANSGQPAPYLAVNGTAPPLYLTSIRDFLQWLDALMIPYGRHIQTRQFTECPPMNIDPSGNYTATLHTTQGDIVLALYPDIAPQTVNNFIFLAENGYYDNTPVYAVIEDYLVRAGDPSGTGWGTPGFLYDLEVSPEVSFARPYMLAMANSGPGTSNSQFFITLSPLTQLNGTSTIFGEVLDGVNVLQALSLRNPDTDPLAPFTDEILSISIEEK